MKNCFWKAGCSGGKINRAIILICVQIGADRGAIFSLIAAMLYKFSGSAPGPYVIVMLTLLGVLIAIVRQSYLRYSFVSVFLCTAAGIMIYEILIFTTGLFFGYTTTSRFVDFCITGGITLAAVPLMYPVFAAIVKFGGETWKE